MAGLYRSSACTCSALACVRQLLAVRHTWRSLHRSSGRCRIDFVLAAFPQARAVRQVFSDLLHTVCHLWFTSGFGHSQRHHSTSLSFTITEPYPRSRASPYLVYYICQLTYGLGFRHMCAAFSASAIRQDWSCNCRQRPVDRRVGDCLPLTHMELVPSLRYPCRTGTPLSSENCNNSSPCYRPHFFWSGSGDRSQRNHPVVPGKLL